VAQEFAPSFAMPDGRIVSVDDSIKVEPGLAPTMLHGLALPRDMERVPMDLLPSLVHASAYIVQVLSEHPLLGYSCILNLFLSYLSFAYQAGQAVLRANQQASLVIAEHKRAYDDLKTERLKSKSYKGSLQTAKATIKDLEKEAREVEDLREENSVLASKLKKAERDLGQVLRREKRKMKEVDEKAYQAGYDRAGKEYLREARSMVNDEIKLRVPIAFRTGYKDGVKATCAVLNPDADLGLIPAPVAPELVLPYTEEECAPLPPEEYPESEEDVEDLTEAEAEANAGDGGEKVGDAAEKVANDELEPTIAKQEGENAAEKETGAVAEKDAGIAAENVAEDVPRA
jgi:hypothetical protein